MRPTPHAPAARIAAFLIVLSLAGAGSPAEAQGAVAVDLELSQQFYYVGDSLTVRLSIGNPGDAKLDNPIRGPLVKGFKIESAEGKKLKASGSASAEEPARPDKLAPGSFYGAVVDLAELYPELRNPGRYKIYWSADGALSEMAIVTVIPRYDPTKAYAGTIATRFGAITIDFYQDQAPLGVKSFIDMANSDFYSGLQFNEVHGGDYVIAGDPRFGQPPRRSITFPAEPTSLPLVTGSVVLKPAGASPPANGSTFVILLKPQPAWTGQVTVIGQVTKGLETVQRISREPSSMRSSQPFFKPLREIMIDGVTISEKATEP
jgi:cyclophilin family peptidyl-prolyl cis-trans isomerase